MLPNFPIIAASAFIPMILGYIWFHPNVFGGNTWYDVAKLTGADRSDVSTPKLLFTLVLNFFIAFGVYTLSVHQVGVFTLVGADPELLKVGTAAAFLAEYGQNHLSFGHGAFHGGIAPSTICFVIPILGYVTIFEKKSFRYFLIYLGYWSISLALMGGVICKWGAIPV